MIIVWGVLLFWALPLLAQVDVPADDENVPTPLTLPELLPEGGIDAVDVDFWLIIKVTYPGNRPSPDRFMHWSAKAVGDKLQFVVETGRAQKDKPHSLATTVYTKDGKFVSFHEISHENGRKTSETDGHVEDNELVLETTPFDEAGKAQAVSVEKQPLKVLETTIPSEWFSLVAAYHIRHGSLGYRFGRTDIHYRFQHAETRLKDLGTEQVAFDGRDYPAHLLKGTRTFGQADSGDDAELVYLIRPNGEMMYMRTLYFGIEFVGRRATQAQVREQFWLPGPVAEKAEAEKNAIAPAPAPPIERD